VFWSLNLHYEIAFTLDFLILRSTNCPAIC